jgi:hypothetical protein
MTFKDAITASTKTICRDITASERVGSQCNAILRRQPFRVWHETDLALAPAEVRFQV